MAHCTSCGREASVIRNRGRRLNQLLTCIHYSPTTHLPVYLLISFVHPTTHLSTNSPIIHPHTSQLIQIHIPIPSNTHLPSCTHLHTCTYMYLPTNSSTYDTYTVPIPTLQATNSSTNQPTYLPTYLYPLSQLLTRLQCT